METQVCVSLLPELMVPDRVVHPAVVIDVLRASTTMVQALAAGAASILPCVEVAEARQLAEQIPSGGAVLAGERGGRAIPGFDLGNCPAEFQPSRVAGRCVVFTTTNGTRALRACGRRPWVILAAFTNLSAVTRVLQSLSAVDLICAGTDGAVSREDVLLAGCLADRLTATGSAGPGNDSAHLAIEAWRGATSGRCTPDLLAAAFADCQGGRNLLQIGRAADLQQAAAVDRWNVVPVYRPSENRIVAW